ncbi:MAG: GHKL domain-containing protein [Clostridia bacterium]|nr:GHKL domain-containing protein [Clostridia bacterium]
MAEAREANHEGRGIGLSSVSNIVKRYGRSLNISRQDGIFKDEMLTNTQMKPSI